MLVMFTMFYNYQHSLETYDAAYPPEFVSRTRLITLSEPCVNKMKKFQVRHRY
eukprot:gene1302-2726_t